MESVLYNEMNPLITPGTILNFCVAKLFIVDH